MGQPGSYYFPYKSESIQARMYPVWKMEKMELPDAHRQQFNLKAEQSPFFKLLYTLYTPIRAKKEKLQSILIKQTFGSFSKV